MNTKLLIAGGVVVLIVVGGVVVVSLLNGQPKDVSVRSSDQQMTNPSTTISDSKTTQPVSQELRWQQSVDGWQSTGSAPDCPPQPMMVAPVDLSLVTAVLYPGQTRGGNYKPHGGVRFDKGTNDDITVTAPVDGFLVRGSRYLEMGEVQYSVDVMHSCGVMYRFDHLRTLSAKLQTIANTWPEPADGDSRTNLINPPVAVNAGETFATSVGFIKDGNAFVDWGVYDFREENEASNSAAFQSAHAQFKELSWHGVCWFDWLPASDETTIRGLPAGDGGSGKTSDYCTQ